MAPLARKEARRSRPISPITSFALFPRLWLGPEFTGNPLSSKTRAVGDRTLPRLSLVGQGRPANSVLTGGGSDGTRTRGLRRDRPAF